MAHQPPAPTPRTAARLGRRSFLGLAAAGAALAACGGGTTRSASSTFPLGAAARASTKPVRITLWHSMSGANGQALTSLTDAFNGSQPNVHVDLVNQNSYGDTLTLYTAALSGGTLPDVVQMESADLQLMIDSRSVVPAQAAVTADHYDLSGFLGAAVDYFRVGGTLWAMPFNISSQVLYYDKHAFSRAGLDPANPPRTLDDLRAAAQKIVSSGTAHYGMSLKLSPSTFEEWMALAGDTILDHDNGRQARATAATFGDATGQSIMAWCAAMFDDKLAQPTSATTYDNLFAIANGIAPMTLETSAALGTVASLLGNYPNVQLGVGPMPGPSGTGGVFVGGAGLYLVARSGAAQQDAAWQYVKFLVSPEQQAQWAAATGYVPLRTASLTVPALTQRWAQIPGFKVAYDQILASPSTPATAGPVCGAQKDVDTAIQNALTAISTGTPASTALSQAVASANQAIATYNRRIQS